MKTKKLVRVENVKHGDVVLCRDGVERTVSSKDIKRGFCGVSIFGDSYRAGILPVKVIEYSRALPKKLK